MKKRANIGVAKGLWIMRGAVNHARFQSRFVALQIQADLMGKPFLDCSLASDKGVGESKTKL